MFSIKQVFGENKLHISLCSNFWLGLLNQVNKNKFLSRLLTFNIFIRFRLVIKNCLNYAFPSKSPSDSFLFFLLFCVIPTSLFSLFLIITIRVIQNTFVHSSTILSQKVVFYLRGDLSIFI